MAARHIGGDPGLNFRLVKLMDAFFQLPLIAVLDQPQGKIGRLALLLGISKQRCGCSPIPEPPLCPVSAVSTRDGFQEPSPPRQTRRRRHRSHDLADGDDRIGVARGFDHIVKTVMGDDGQGIDGLNARFARHKAGAGPGPRSARSEYPTRKPEAERWCRGCERPSLLSAC